MLNRHWLRLALVWLVILALARGGYGADQPRYLAFQIYPGSGSIQVRQILPGPKDLHTTISELKDRIGVVGTDNRHLGFVLGPLALDDTEQIQELIASGFDTALKTGVAVGFHLDDSMFWGRLKELNKPENVEWLDWGSAKRRARPGVGPAKPPEDLAAALSQQERSAKRRQDARHFDWKRNRQGRR